MMDEVGEDLCFSFENGNSQLCQQAYDYYKLKDPGSFDEWGYDNKTVIFLDTNFLLTTYFLSKVERISIIKFISANKERIVIASRVDDEYQKHRLEFISGYNKKLDQLGKDTKGIIDSCLKSLNGDSIEKIKGLAGNHVLKYDFGGDSIDLCQILNALQTYHDCLKEDREKIIKSLRDFQEHICSNLSSNTTDVETMYMDDELLHAIAQCTILPPLSKKENDFVKQKYEECLETFEKKRGNEVGRYRYAFPGCGDKRKDESEDRIKESDMVIYHEMLKYMKLHDKDVVFLTLDLKKGDWVPSYGHNDVFLHYIENQFVQTGHVIYIKAGDELPLMFEKEPLLDEESDSDSDDSSVVVQAEGAMTLFGETDSVECDNSTNNQVEPIGNSLSVSSSSSIVRQHKNYRKIDEDRFLSELQTCTKWANEYGAGYVGRDYFIYGLLGKQKHFEFNQSRLVYKSLLKSGRILENADKEGGKIISVK